MPGARIHPSDGAAFWLFADAARHYPIGAIPAQRTRARALLLAADGGTPIRLPASGLDADGDDAAATGFRVGGTLSLNVDGDAQLRATAQLRGANGYHAAAQLATAEDNLRRAVARQVGGRILRGWTLEDAQLGSLEPGNTLSIEVDARRRRALTRDGEHQRLRLPLPPSEFAAAYGDREHRTLPLAFRNLLGTHWEIVVDPGDAFTVTSLPRPVHVAHGLIEFSLTWRAEGPRVRITRNVTLRPGTVEPARFQEWRGLLHRLDQAEQQSMELLARPQ